MMAALNVERAKETYRGDRQNCDRKRVLSIEAGLFEKAGLLVELVLYVAVRCEVAKVGRLSLRERTLGSEEMTNKWGASNS